MVEILGNLGERIKTLVAKESGKCGKLPPKQALFVNEYIIDFNGTQAAIRAGYSEKTAAAQAYDLLRKPDIQEEIARRMKDREKRTEITQDRVLQEVARLAFLDIRKALTNDGNLKAISELDDDTAAAIAGLEILEEFQGQGKDREFVGYTKKIRLSDKKGALELLMRHLGMLNDKMKLQGDAENPLVMLLKQLSGTSLPIVKD